MCLTVVILHSMTTTPDIKTTCNCVWRPVSVSCPVIHIVQHLSTETTVGYIHVPLTNLIEIKVLLPACMFIQYI